MNLKRVFNPKSVREVIELLAKYGNEAKLIAGGTDIVIALKNEKISPSVLIDISKLERIKKIEDDGEYIKIGAGVTFTQVVESDLFQDNLRGLKKACQMVGAPQIRNKGTIGGNIANGAAAADSAPPLICLESIIVLESLEGRREILLEDYYKNPIKTDEILTHIKFKKPEREKTLTFAKLGLRKALAISRLTNSMMIEVDDENKIIFARVASGALARTPVREYQVEDYLLGKKIDEDTIKGATQVLKESMEKRLKGRSTLPYKSQAIKRTVREALEEALV